MTDKIIHLRKVKCSSSSSSATNLSRISKRTSILKTSTHKKHLSVKFADQAPDRSLKTLSQDLDRISSAIDSVFPYQHKHLKPDPRVAHQDSSGGRSVPAEAMTQSYKPKDFNLYWRSEKRSQMNKNLQKQIQFSHIQRFNADILKDKYENLAENKAEVQKLDLKVVKKKTSSADLMYKVPLCSMGIGHHTIQSDLRFKVSSNAMQSPKVIKSSGHIRVSKFVVK